MEEQNYNDNDKEAERLMQEFFLSNWEDLEECWETIKKVLLNNK